MTGMVFERYPGGGGELLLALALADNAHDDGTRIFPSVATLSKRISSSSLPMAAPSSFRPGRLQARLVVRDRFH